MGPNDDNPADGNPPRRPSRSGEPRRRPYDRSGRPYDGPGDPYDGPGGPGGPGDGRGSMDGDGPNGGAPRRRPSMGRAQVPWPPPAIGPAVRRLMSRFRTGPIAPPPRHASAGRGLPPQLAIATPSERRKRRQRRLMAAFAIFIMLIGVVVIGGTYFVDGVKTSDQLKFPATTTVYYSDGTPISKLGEETRYELKYEEMNDAVLKTVVASEDQTFWTNGGVDFGSVLRAAWNNFTGGNVQGGSTITQQYARLAFDLQGVTYQRKAREAVLAWKISDKLSKEQILASYLNAVPFGRQTYGIEAAKRTAPPEQQITWAEAMVLIAMVKQPNPDPGDPKGHPGYDPTFSPEAK